MLKYLHNHHNINYALTQQIILQIVKKLLIIYDIKKQGLAKAKPYEFE